MSSVNYRIGHDLDKAVNFRNWSDRTFLLIRLEKTREMVTWYSGEMLVFRV